MFAEQPRRSDRAAYGSERRTIADASFATTLANGLQILAVMPSDGSGVGNSALAAELGLSRPTVSRLCATLVELGYLVKGSDGRYRSGPRVLALAHPMLASLRIRQSARPHMRDFAEYAQGNVSLAIFDGLYAVSVETIRMFDGNTYVPEIGMQVPLEKSSLGRALLSMQPEEARNRILGKIARTRPENWQRYGEEALQAIESCRIRGFCVSLGTFHPALYSAAAPLGRTEDGNYIAINCGIPSYRSSAADMQEQWGPRIAALAQSIRALEPALKVPPDSISPTTKAQPEAANLPR